MEIASSNPVPWGPVGYITYKRTYSRRLKENDKDSPTEEFDQTVERVVKACRIQLKVGFTPEEEDDVRDIFMNLEGSVAGRFWWQLGTKTIDRLGMFSLQNCAFVTVNEPIRPFTWTMDALMLGSGVGYNIQRENVYQLPKVKKAKIVHQDGDDVDFIVPDNREGWVKLLGKVLKSHFYSGKGFTYSTHCVRGKDAPIRSFGGTASGPEVLNEGIANISKVLNSRAGKQLRPIDVLDIMNIIGYIVVAGNVRRSAQIAIGDPDDVQFLNAKIWTDKDGNPTGIPAWRAMSNNSVASNDINLLTDAFWDGYTTPGREAYGIINLNLARSVGRLGETQYPDPDVEGFNPCAEQGLANHETCCLAELFLPNIKSKERLLTVAKYLYRICKHSLRLPSHSPETEAIVHKNMRMGIGVTGYLQATEEQKGWLKDVYEELRKYDAVYSMQRGWPTSIKLTTVKPSGTLSLLAGVTPGGHPALYKHYIRRITMAASSDLVRVCRENGFPIEYKRNLGVEDRNSVVVEFPCKTPDGTILAEELGAIAQLEIVKRLQTEWSDNSVSVTVYYTHEELPEIKEWLRKNYNDGVKTVSFMLRKDNGWDQAPYEEITEEVYNDLVEASTPIAHIAAIREDEVSAIDECAGGVCPIK